jgi:uncharacterized protein with ParB-like and HNH nuclease domain
MSSDGDDLYSVFIDYEQKRNFSIHDVSHDRVMQTIAQNDFGMQKRTLKQILKDQEFNIPEYQRSYSWTEHQHRQFWDDIRQFVNADLVTDEENVSDVFFSTMYFAVDADSEVYDVIDGQQRLTTTHILLRVILEHLQEIEKAAIEEDELADLWEWERNTIEELLYVVGDYGQREPRLTLNKHDAEFFDALIHGTEAQIDYLTSDLEFDIHGNNSNAIRISRCRERFGITTDELGELDVADSLPSNRFFRLYDSHEKLLSAYEFYQKKIETIVDRADTTDDTVRALLNVSRYLQHAFHVGEYVIRQAEADFRMQIFEILNDRGVELTKIDRIRAAVVNAFYDPEDGDDYIRKWESIVSEFGGDDGRIDDYLSVYLTTVDTDVDTIGEASDELTNAFNTRKLDGKATPRLKDPEDAKEFINRAEELVGYYKQITDPELDRGDLQLAAHEQEIQEILIRLNVQGMDQWRPLVLALYYHADANSEADAATLYNVLDAIEKLNFRRLLVSENPNIFSNIFIEAVDEFELSPLDDTGLEDELDGALIEYLIDQTRSEAASLFGDRFINLATQAQDWNTRSAKLLFGRITHEHYRNSGGNLERTLDMSGIHIEHVLPQTPVTDSTRPVWLPKFFPPESTEEDLVEAVDRYLELEHRKRTESETDLKENEEKDRAKIEEYIKQRFIDDLGNFLLLGEGDNIRASNRPLAQKLPQYYNHVDEFTSIHPNRYFTPEEGPIDRDELEDLRTQYGAKHDDATQRTKIDENLKEEFNSLWTHATMKDRRVELLLDILETLRFDALKDEFGMESSEEETREKVRELTDEVFKNRTSLQSL